MRAQKTGICHISNYIGGGGAAAGVSVVIPAPILVVAATMNMAVSWVDPATAGGYLHYAALIRGDRQPTYGAAGAVWDSPVLWLDKLYLGVHTANPAMIQSQTNHIRFPAPIQFSKNELMTLWIYPSANGNLTCEVYVNYVEV